MPDPTPSDPGLPDPAHLDHADSHASGSHPAPPDAPPPTGRWLVRLPVAARVDPLAALNDDLIRAGRASRRRRVLVAAARLAATFCIGVAVTLAWQPYGDAARMIIASASPQLGWLAPQGAPAAPRPAAAAAAGPQPRSTTASDLDVVQERIDRIVDIQEQMTRAVARLSAGQERIAEEIAKVREVEQYLLYKTSYKGDEGTPARPATAVVGHKPGRRSSLAAR